MGMVGSIPISRRSKTKYADEHEDDSLDFSACARQTTVESNHMT